LPVELNKFIALFGGKLDAIARLTLHNAFMLFGSTQRPLQTLSDESAGAIQPLNYPAYLPSCNVTLR
jgi:hypothetical protein